MAAYRFLVGIAALAAVVLTASQGRTQVPDSRFAGWASAVIAADWTDSEGRPIDAFDNARRDLAAGFQAAGFDPSLMVDYSLRPDAARPVTADAALQGFAAATERGARGCLFYITSHGNPAGVVFGPNRHMTPRQMDAALDRVCQTRPTVVIVSACFSGVFVPAL